MSRERDWANGQDFDTQTRVEFVLLVHAIEPAEWDGTNK
jgi:hypothetical protein